MNADDLFGPETDDEKEAAKDHPMMRAFLVEQESKSFLQHLMDAMGVDRG